MSSATTGLRGSGCQPTLLRTSSAVSQQRPSAAPRRLAVQAIAAPTREPETLSASAAGLEAARRQAAATTTSAARTGRVVLESEDELRSTWEHRAWVGGATALMAATLATGVAQIDGPGAAAGAAAAALAAYLMADVGTAFYHWGGE